MTDQDREAMLTKLLDMLEERLSEEQMDADFVEDVAALRNWFVAQGRDLDYEVALTWQNVFDKVESGLTKGTMNVSQVEQPNAARRSWEKIPGQNDNHAEVLPFPRKGIVGTVSLDSALVGEAPGLRLGKYRRPEIINEARATLDSQVAPRNSNTKWRADIEINSEDSLADWAIGCSITATASSDIAATAAAKASVSIVIRINRKFRMTKHALPLRLFLFDVSGQQIWVGVFTPNTPSTGPIDFPGTPLAELENWRCEYAFDRQ